MKKILVVLTLIFVSSVASAQSILNAGDTIYSPGSLTSPNGVNELRVQGDGNLVLYRNGSAVWSTGTYNAGSVVLSMQGDGNLVLYKTSNWQAVWSSNTWNIGSGARLSVQDDGNVVVYNASWTPKWATNTYQEPGSSYATLQNPAQDSIMRLRSTSQCIRFEPNVFSQGTSQTFLRNLVGVDKGKCINFKVELKPGTIDQYYLTTSSSYDEDNIGQVVVEGANFRYLSNRGSDNNNKRVKFSTSFNGTSKFIWRFKDKGNGFDNIISLNSGKCLDIGSSGDLKQHNCHNGTNQQFYFPG